MRGESECADLVLLVVNEFNRDLLPAEHIGDIGAKSGVIHQPHILPVKNLPGLGDCQLALIRRRARDDYLVTIVKSGIPDYFIAHFHNPFVEKFRQAHDKRTHYEPGIVRLVFAELKGKIVGGVMRKMTLC